MPEEIFVIVVVAIIAGTILPIAKLFFGYASSRQQQRTPAGSSLTTSELAQLVREAVEEGTARLEARFDALERRMDEMEAHGKETHDGQARLPQAGGRLASDLLPETAREEELMRRRSRMR